ncbi:MAG: hypothetical protein WBV94_17315 [Blastocatellia bacterium]
MTAEQVAQWYVWRWKVESYFKLLKSSGHNLENWQQESAEAITRRPVVTAMATVVIWQLARSQAPESETDAARPSNDRISDAGWIMDVAGGTECA